MPPIDIKQVTPDTVTEGEMTVIILSGKQLDENVRVTVGGMDLTVEQTLLSPDKTALGMLVKVPVLPNYGPQDTPISLTVTVEQGPAEQGPAEKDPTDKETMRDSIDIPVMGLTELEIDASEFNTDELEARYSEITIASAVTLLGELPARFVATNAIHINAPVNASGRDASAPAGADSSDRLGGLGGPGGCRGGDADQSGACQTGGGSNGGAGADPDQEGGSGGGGGCEGVAESGRGPRSGAGGQADCSNALVPLGAASNRGHGGGGGGSGTSGAYPAAGGGGGGGGGVVEITAPTVVLNAVVSVRGGTGGAGQRFSPCQQQTHGGSGGGGSGGAVLVRALELITIDQAIDVAPGTSPETCNRRGGKGSEGRIRFDIVHNATLDKTIGEFAGNYWYGPMLQLTTGQRLVDRPEVAITVSGDPDSTYDLRVGTAPAIEVFGEQTVSVKDQLVSGRNEICAVVQNATPTLPEAKNCLTVAVIAE